MNNVQDKSEPGSRRPATAGRRQLLAERLIDAAVQALTRSGVQDLRARALADAAGCSVGAIYGVFPDLDELILSVNLRTLDAIDAAMAEASSGQGPQRQLADLASIYLDFALAHRGPWNALFQHRMVNGRAVPDWYAQRLQRAFTHVEAPLAALQPGLEPPACVLLAHTMFAAVHGMVALGLDSTSGKVPPEVLRAQIHTVVAAMARGLAAGAC